MVSWLGCLMGHGERALTDPEDPSMRARGYTCTPGEIFEMRISSRRLHKKSLGDADRMAGTTQPATVPLASQQGLGPLWAGTSLSSVHIYMTWKQKALWP
ncbi:hypothetical protein HJFPF1_01780 [Paramyrothecium foliicola]|nr:hypothetical protein HJFPF1_01780 [Paramyrothecium foliicola]